MMEPSLLLRMLTPEQQARLAQIQAVTSRIFATTHTEDGRITVELSTDDPQALAMVPEVAQQIETSVANILYQLFAIQGRRI